MMSKERFSSLLVKDFVPPAASLFSWTEAGHGPAPSLRLPFLRMGTSLRLYVYGDQLLFSWGQAVTDLHYDYFIMLCENFFSFF